MADRRIEMHEYREALSRMRRGERDRQMARDGVIGRHKLEWMTTYGIGLTTWLRWSNR